MSQGNWRTYVVVIERGKQSWTLGPFHQRSKAESAQAALLALPEQQPSFTSWIEPVMHPDEFKIEALLKMDD